MKLVLVTGMSGAGKSVALKTLEDSGYEAVDNLPLSLIETLVGQGRVQRMAIGVDIRARDFSAEDFAKAVRPLRANAGLQLSIVYLDCDDDVLNRRFSETRRRHPLAADRTALDGIKHERSLLGNVRELADLVIDTSELPAGELRRVISGHFAGNTANLLSLHVCSFSYKRGIPREADLLFDVRFLKNPFYEDALRDLTGLDEKVGAYIEQDEAFHPFVNHLEAMLTPLLPRYQQEGKCYLTIALGCTGGQHRSVFAAEKLAAFLKNKGYNVSIRHRDL